MHASVCTMNGLSHLGKARTGAVVSASFSLMMAACALSFWLSAATSTPFRVSSVRGLAIAANPLMCLR